ncbi:YqaI family protein [Neobacillus vireti]|uniref:YqaI family protein n=1 Tax=Neobacillus vireti TaxID=220686 RepID=UPI002FFFC204
MEKAKLIISQADALEMALKKSKGDKQSIISWHVQDFWAGDEEPLNKLSLDTLIIALYFGFEIEEGPESFGDDVMGDEILKGDYYLEHDGELILEINAIDYLCDHLGAVKKTAGE